MLDFDECWAALEKRDAGAAGRFFYGVRTTGVYCRPGCTSRMPLRKNTIFFETLAEAEAAGLRPCKRCRPADGSAASRHVAAIEKACALLRQSEMMPTLAELADAAGISPFHFHRVFKQITGATPRDYARTHRLGRFAEKLDAGEPVTEAIYASGFGSSSRAYEAAPAGLGMTPGARRRGGDGQTIRYATIETPLGWALVAATERGICEIAFDPDPEAEVQRLARLYGSRVLRSPRPVEAARRELDEYFEGRRQEFDLPVDLEVLPAFQQAVLTELRRVPYGQVDTYGGLATKIGRPRAARAVGGALNRNPVPIVVPCHRIVGASGSLVGYAGGLERKQLLLGLEGGLLA
jgi:AraC family transcriptional regulator of adaptative response/methylated-DNA-[protein]-cysteine methyltransferase